MAKASVAQKTNAATEVVFSRASTSAARYVADSNDDNTTQLDDSLMDAIKHLSAPENTARLSLRSRPVHELLSYSSVILTVSTTNAITRSRFHRLLFNIGLYNVSLRKFMAHDLELCSAVFHCLKASLREQLGPQNMIDILRLLQVLSYERTVTLGIWTNELISFLMSEVIREPEQEWMPYCMAILCNLASRSKSVCNRIKKSSSYKSFSRKIMALLSHDSRIVVVSALVLIGYLEEKVRDMVYCSQNIHETFQCVFNVLIMGDTECLMTRHIAADLLRRLVVSDVSTVSSTPVLATTGKDVMNYGFFDRCIQQTAELLVFLDPRLEESVKVYDLLLSFCKLTSLRSPVCSSIIRCPPTEARLTTPILAVASTCAMTFDDSINREVPLKALRLLAYLAKEIIDANERLMPYIPIEQITDLISSCVSTPIDTGDDDSAFACQRVQLGFRLAEVCSQDEDVRNELFDVTTAQLCAGIAEFQLMRNPIVGHLSKPPVHRGDGLPLWSVNGVGIVLELSRLLASLKDHSKLHKDQYWRLLKDERLIPFLAYAIAHGDHEMVFHALVTFTHCSQVHVFPTHLLGELVASCALEKRVRLDAQPPMAPLNTSTERANKSCSPDPAYGYSNTSKDESMERKKNNSTKALDELLGKISNGFDAKDLRMSEVLTAYERKITLLESRERDLEALIAAKDQTLSQSEKLRVHYRNGAAGYTSENDVSQVRSLMQECETLRETNSQVTRQLQMTKQSFDEKITILRDELTRTRQERESLVQEMEQERALVVAARNTADDLKRKLEIASATAIERQNEILNLNRDKNDLTNALLRQKQEIELLRQSHEKEVERMHGDVAQQVATIERLFREKNDLKQKLDMKELECASLKDQNSQIDERLTTKEKECSRLSNALAQLEAKFTTRERECTTHMAELETLRSKGKKTQADLEKMQRLRAEMIQLAGNYE